MCADHARLVLFDVDGTLVLAGSTLHLRAMREAFTEVFGVAPPLRSDRSGVPYLAEHSLAGLIDREVFAAAARGCGIDQAELAERYPHLLEVFVDRYEALLSSGASPGIPMPGAHATLAGLARAGCVLGLLTGNAHQVAQAKLSGVGLAEFFSFDPAAGFGAFARDRAALVPAAVAFATRTAPVDVRHAALVGDTPSDVAAALSHGLRSVAVASGAADHDTLRAAGAHLVLDDLLGADVAILDLLG